MRALAALSILASSAPAADPPPLVVLVVVDQLGSETMARWERHLTGGLARLLRRGAYYPNGVHQQASTATGPGHASIATGSWPNVHGIPSNTWNDPATGAPVYCVESGAQTSPARLMAPTIGDQLQWITGGRGKVVSLAIKDRVAVLSGSRRPTLAAWYHEPSGRFTAGTWYRSPAPPWLETINERHGAAAAIGKVWDRLDPRVDYQRIAGADAASWEAALPELGNTFPRTYGRGTRWNSAYRATPAAMEALFEIAQRSIDELELGADREPDLLFIGVSTFDYAGHFFGPESQESLDLFLRLDQALGRLIDHLESRSGGRRALWVLTGDHGVARTPEAAAAAGVDARRVHGRELRERVEQALAAFAPKGKKPLTIALIDPPLIYLEHGEASADRLALARAAAAAIAAHPNIAEAYAARDVDRFSEPYRLMYQRVLYPGREPDILYRGRPGDLIDSQYETGTNHGSPYNYDTHVPIIVAGPRVARGVDRRPFAITTIAPSIAAALGFPPPAAAMDPPLPAVN